MCGHGDFLMADAASLIIGRDSKTTTGNHFIDEDVLRDEGIVNLDAYSIMPGAVLQRDLFL